MSDATGCARRDCSWFIVPSATWQGVREREQAVTWSSVEHTERHRFASSHNPCSIHACDQRIPWQGRSTGPVLGRVMREELFRASIGPPPPGISVTSWREAHRVESMAEERVALLKQLTAWKNEMAALSECS